MNRPEVRQAGVRDVAFGVRVTIVEPCNVYGCKIGDDCFVGPFTEIQKGVVVGARTRVQSHAFICELVTIGEDCFVGYQNYGRQLGCPVNVTVAWNIHRRF